MKDIIRAITEAITRFFDNRFVVDNSRVLYLEMMVERERQEKQKLLDYILQLSVKSAEPEEEKPMPLPLETNARVPWHIRQRQLEEDDRKIAELKKQHSADREIANA